jgi:hypothetical protein
MRPKGLAGFTYRLYFWPADLTTAGHFFGPALNAVLGLHLSALMPACLNVGPRKMLRRMREGKHCRHAALTQNRDVAAKAKPLRR